MREQPREPTGDECETGAAIGAGWFAAWYPQMGGYCGKAAVKIDVEGCFDCYVWHDGDFPFEGDSPRRLHHCDPEQFIEFGEFVKEVACKENKK